MTLKIDWNSNITKLLTVVIVSWISLAIIFGLTDLIISKAVVNRESGWAIFGDNWAEAPGYGIIAVAIAIFVGSYQDDLKKQKIAAYVILIIGIIFLVIALIVNDLWYMGFGGGITFGILIFLIYAFNKDWREFKTIAIVILLLA
ncbi:MAG: hypothetical protein ACFFAN_16840, partial [Promethearchaeota archaeon]